MDWKHQTPNIQKIFSGQKRDQNGRHGFRNFFRKDKVSDQCIRHNKNLKVDAGKSPSQDRGYIAGLLWGGSPGRSWANKIIRQMDAADKKSKQWNYRK